MRPVFMPLYSCIFAKGGILLSEDFYFHQHSRWFYFAKANNEKSLAKTYFARDFDCYEVFLDTCCQVFLKPFSVVNGRKTLLFLKSLVKITGVTVPDDFSNLFC